MSKTKCKGCDNTDDIKLGTECPECKQSYHYKCRDEAFSKGTLNDLHDKDCTYEDKKFTNQYANETDPTKKTDGKKKRRSLKKKRRSLKKKRRSLKKKRRSIRN